MPLASWTMSGLKPAARQAAMNPFQYDLNGLLRQLGQPHFVVPGDQ